MRIRITKPGIHVGTSKENPTGELKVGTEITLKEEPKGWAGRYEIIEGGPAKQSGGSDAKKYEASHQGSGVWAVMDGDKIVVEKLNKADAESFNKMSDKDKADYVAAAKK